MLEFLLALTDGSKLILVEARVFLKRALNSNDIDYKNEERTKQNRGKYTIISVVKNQSKASSCHKDFVIDKLK